MNISDKLKDLGEKAKESAVEHKDQIKDAVEKAEVAADRKTGGQYHDQIVNAGAKVQSYVEGLDPAAPPAAKGQPSGGDSGEPPPERQAPDSSRSD
jgi:uncharacterized protein YPO0396